MIEYEKSSFIGISNCFYAFISSYKELVQGYKVWGNFTDYSVKNSYDNVMKQLPKQDYNWYISIKTEKTAVFAIIGPADKKTMDNEFCFGDDDEWCVTWCWVSKSQGKNGAVLFSEKDGNQTVYKAYSQRGLL